MRLNRYLASAGLGSRRSCEKLIREGRVSINGHFVDSLAAVVGEGDDVRVVGRRIQPPVTSTVVALYKPKGFLCTRSDERSRRTIYDLLPRTMTRLAYVGRLDKESEGLLLLTDDGGLSQKISHPSAKMEKVYEVELDGPLDEESTGKLLRGFPIIGGRARMESLKRLGGNRVRVVLTQGIKRQIRLMFYRVGLEVTKLTRTRIGPIPLSPLKPGEWRPLNAAEIAQLRGEPRSRPKAARKPRPL
ncbi:MAG: pseudouridine synthase [Terrimicrobiaceae bacterium]